MRVLDQAIDWQLRMSSGEATERDTLALEFWLSAHPDHARAWQQLASLDTALLPAEAAPLRNILTRPIKSQRLKRLAGAVGMLAMLCAGLALLDQYLPLAHVLADFQTVQGERKLVVLADNTQLRLNTRSAVDLAYDEQQRTIILREGEVEIETGHDENETRPLVVVTPAGSMQALGTRFVVRTLAGESSLVSVTDSAVMVRPAYCSSVPADGCEGQQLLEAGQSMILAAGSLTPALPSPPYIDAWKDGMLVVENATLADVVAELGRYHLGYLRVSPEVAELRISGTFPVDDVDFAAHALGAALPVRVLQLGKFWVSFAPLKDIGFAQKREPNAGSIQP